VGVEIALGAYILPDDHSVFKFFPGKSYKFYDLVVTSNLALIDVRGLDELSSDPGKWSDKEILTRISVDRVARQVARGGRRPTRLVNSVGDKQALTFIRGLFFRAEKGDLILVPAKGYTSMVMVGELLDDPGILRTVDASDDKIVSKYYGRRVKWVARLEKRLFSSEVIKLLHSQAAFFDVGYSHYEEVYNLAFDNFVYDKQVVSTFRTSKRVFTSKDNLLTSLWFELIEVLQESQDQDAKLTIKSIYELAVESDISEDDRNDLAIHIQSPGWFRWRALTTEPLTAMALYSLAINAIPFEQAKAATVSAKVIRNADKQCLGKVDESVRQYLEILGKDRWEQACKLAKKTEKEATLKTDATLKKS